MKKKSKNSEFLWNPHNARPLKFHYRWTLLNLGYMDDATILQLKAD